MKRNSYLQGTWLGLLALIFAANITYAQDLSALGLPALTSATGVNGETTYSLSLQILLLMTALTVLPSLVLGMTAFRELLLFCLF
jgi:flagellar biosynthetic protein FliP